MIGLRARRLTNKMADKRWTQLSPMILDVNVHLAKSLRAKGIVACWSDMSEMRLGTDVLAVSEFEVGNDKHIYIYTHVYKGT